MNRKFFINGLIVSRLMTILEISPLELSTRLGKTRQAISQIQKRTIIKDSDATKILSALGVTIEEVETMDANGVFLKKNIAEISTPKLIDQPENNYLKDALERIEGSFKDAWNEEQKRHQEEVAFYRTQLLSKETQIATLIEVIGKKDSPVTNNNPEPIAEIVQLNKTDGYVPSLRVVYKEN